MSLASIAAAALKGNSSLELETMRRLPWRWDQTAGFKTTAHTSVSRDIRGQFRETKLSSYSSAGTSIYSKNMYFCQWLECPARMDRW